MTTFTANGIRPPFRIGAPTLPARRAEVDVDPYARRAIRQLSDALAKLKWTPPQDARAQWVDQFVVPLVQNPFRNPDDAANGIELEQVLAQDGKTPLVNETRRVLWSQQRGLNASAVLGDEVLFLWLVAEAIYEQGLPDGASVAQWLLEEGVGLAYPVLVVLAVRDYVRRNRVETGDAAAWKAHLDREVRGTDFSFVSGVFEKAITRLVEDYTFRRGPLQHIKQVDSALNLAITQQERDYLVGYFEQAGITLTAPNREPLVTSALLQYRSSTDGMLGLTDSVLAPLDFDVDYHEDTVSTTPVLANNVRSAAQLFYVMTLGDELGVFRAVDLLITRYLSAGRLDVRSPRLLRDLQDYALNQEFRNRRGRVLQRSSEEERLMFYRQVFDVGDAELVDGMVTNPDFAHLWNSLMVETVRYLEKVERSERPEDLVSRNAIGRVMEDLQYNLSSHASGMAKMIAPLIYEELDFAIERIFKDQEVVDQLALHGNSSYWRVIERLLREDRQRGVNITALQKKAKRGHQILAAVADYSEAMLADDAAFSQFVGRVEEFILAAEQLEDGQEQGGWAPPVPAGVPAGAAPRDDAAGSSDWSF